MSRLSAAASAVVLIGALASNPAEAVQRVFVASYGNDANTATNCGFTNPCRGFTAAMTVVDSGGEVVALDAAGYGAVTITKSVTITANPGFYAGISASTGNAVAIATAGVNVTLRGLNINGIGASYGVYMSDGTRLSIENCVISNFSSTGVFVTGSTTVRIVDSLVRDNNEGIYLLNGPTATISGTKVMGNGQHGVIAYGLAAGTTTTAAVSDSILTGNNTGVRALNQGATSVVRVSVSRVTASHNAYGLLVTQNDAGAATLTASNNLVTHNGSYGLANASGTFESLGNNTVRQNGVNTIGTITSVSGLVAPRTGNTSGTITSVAGL